MSEENVKTQKMGGGTAGRKEKGGRGIGKDAEVDFPVLDITGAQQLLKSDILNAAKSPDATSTSLRSFETN